MKEKYVWIQTRDGSPTLWHNELGEPFRSYKGAFSESWAAFVGPALQQVKANTKAEEITVGEFGLGPGTNWLLWSLAARAYKIPTRYFAIERDSESFAMGRQQWLERSTEVSAFLSTRLGLPVEMTQLQEELAALPHPTIYPSLEAAVQAGEQVRIWFHDPFGFEVNPDAYGVDCLAHCARLWQDSCWGGSYACNRSFRDALEAQGVQVAVLPIGADGLKRERLEFTRRPQ